MGKAFLSRWELCFTCCLSFIVLFVCFLFVVCLVLFVVSLCLVRSFGCLLLVEALEETTFPCSAQLIRRLSSTSWTLNGAVEGGPLGALLVFESELQPSAAC